MKEIAKKLIRLVLGQYAAYFIYTNVAEKALALEAKSLSTFKVFPVNLAAIAASAEPLIREQIGYAGPDSYAYACFDQERMVGVCFYWFGQRYRTRNFWPLQKDEAKLVQIIALPEMRGRGIATMLITQSCQDMRAKGFTRTFARIWHSNTPSIRAFDRANWVRIALVLEINPFRQSLPYRIRFNTTDRESRIQKP